MAYNGSTLTEVLDRYDPNREIAIGNFAEALVNPEREYVPTIIPDYLEPVGDSGWFFTPDEPADPQDCARYPDSPWCGGTGLTPVPVGIYPTGFSSNICETCITIGSSLFFIAMPQHELCYRSKQPGCTPPEDPPPAAPAPPAPTATPPVFTPFTPPSGRAPCDGCITTSKMGLPQIDEDGNLGVAESFRCCTDGPPIGVYSTTVVFEDPETNTSTGSGYYALVGCTPDGPVVSPWRGPYGLTFYRDPDKGPFFAPGPYIIEISSAPECPPNPPPKFPKPPPPPPPPDSCMCCCNSQKEDSNVEELLIEIARRLGTDKYPVSTPEWLVTNLGNKSVAHQSITELTVWLTQQVDALAGEFPIKVDIEDADPTQEGDQSKQIVLPNIAESLAEIYGLAAKSAIDSDVHTSFLMRLASEAIATKVAVLIAQDYASANASFLGYKGNEVKRKVSFAFNPKRQDSLETILESSEAEYAGWRNEDQETVFDYLQKLMFSAGIIKNVFFRNKRDVEKILNDLREFEPKKDEDGDDKWKDFLNSINNPESKYNKESSVKPEIDNYSDGTGQS